MSKHRYEKILISHNGGGVFYDALVTDIDIKTPRRNKKYSQIAEVGKTMKINNNKRPRQRGKRR